LVLCVCSLLAVLASAGYLAAPAFSALFAVAVLHAAMLAPLVPLSDALATTAARISERHGGKPFTYGWLRAAGPAAFVAGTVISGGLTGATGLTGIVWIGGLLARAGRSCRPHAACPRGGRGQRENRVVPSAARLDSAAAQSGSRAATHCTTVLR